LRACYLRARQKIVRSFKKSAIPFSGFGAFTTGDIMSTTNTDRDILARTLWGEARGEGLAGEIAVAWTIRNRVFDGNPKSWWGEGYAGGGMKPWQFSCWNQNDPNYAYLSGAKAIPDAQFA
jgi:hypothetical protein